MHHGCNAQGVSNGANAVAEVGRWLESYIGTSCGGCTAPVCLGLLPRRRWVACRAVIARGGREASLRGAGGRLRRLRGPAKHRPLLLLEAAGVGVGHCDLRWAAACSRQL